MLGVPAQRTASLRRGRSRRLRHPALSSVTASGSVNSAANRPSDALPLDRQRFDIVGITPASFFGVEVGRYFDVALPICAEPLVARENSALSRRHYWWLASLGRLKPGWTREQAAAHVNAISAGLFEVTVPEVYQAETIKGYQALRLTAEPGRGRSVGLAPGVRDAAGSPARDDGPRAADCLRQPHQSAAGPGQRTRARDLSAWPLAPRAAASCGNFWPRARFSRQGEWR